MKGVCHKPRNETLATRVRKLRLPNGIMASAAVACFVIDSSNYCRTGSELSSREHTGKTITIQRHGCWNIIGRCWDSMDSVTFLLGAPSCRCLAMPIFCNWQARDSQNKTVRTGSHSWAF
ncbi:hypothetical protein K1719_037715 [Acacia pycnantha]|nr:hypothetical protein K1719_037715 [Acacia pycnantha]